MKDLSIIVLSYNTASLTKDCLDALIKSLTHCLVKAEVIVVDNASTDESVAMLKKYEANKRVLPVDLIVEYNEKNAGFPGGNNQALKKARGRYVLYLNSDVIVNNVDFSHLISYFDAHPKVGGLTVRVVLPSGKIDPASHRGFPTPWNSLSYFLGLERIFGKVPFLNRIFCGYHLTYRSLHSVHEIDAPAAAFYLTRKDILNKLGGFDDKNFFMYGEDIDLTFRTKQLGYKILYYPKYHVTHHKWASGLKNKNPEIKKRTRSYFNQAMKTFYKKHYEKKYPRIVSLLIYFFIDLKNRTR